MASNGRPTGTVTVTLDLPTEAMQLVRNLKTTLERKTGRELGLEKVIGMVFSQGLLSIREKSDFVANLAMEPIQ